MVILGALLACKAPPPVAATDASAGQMAFRDVTVLSMTAAGTQPKQTVVIGNGRILSVGPSEFAQIPPEARIIDGAGHTLMPGLIDTHVHLDPDHPEWLGLYLLHGITTIVNLKGEPRHLRFREEQRAGRLEGPHIYTAGPLVQRPEVDTPAAAEAAIRRQADAGYDAVKLYSSLSPEAFRAAVATAEALDFPVVGHVPEALSCTEILTAGLASFTHIEELGKCLRRESEAPSSEQISALARALAAQDGFVITTLALSGDIAAQWGNPNPAHEALEEPGSHLIPAEIRAFWEWGNPYSARGGPGDASAEDLSILHALHLQIAVELADKGARLVVGTDAPLPLLAPGAGIHRELRVLREIGLSAEEALGAATRGAGAFLQEGLGVEEPVGAIVPGQRADLLLVVGDPLVDPGVFFQPEGVMLGGRWFGQEALTQIRSEAEMRSARTIGAHFRLTPFEGDFSGNNASVSVRAEGGLLVGTLPNGAATVFEPAADGSFRALGQDVVLLFSADHAEISVTTRGAGSFKLRRQAAEH